MRESLELPRLSLAERDRRYAAVRKQMADRELDAIVLWGWPTMWDFYTANARYLSSIGGNAEFNVVIFPAAGEPTSLVQAPTLLDGWRAAQNWVNDIRPRTKTWRTRSAAALRS
jgi:Xaa-Pro dipeptidase